VPAIGFLSVTDQQKKAGFQPEKADYRIACVTVRGIGTFDDAPAGEIPYSYGRWHCVSRGLTPSHRVAAHLWCATSEKTFCKNAFFWVPKPK
jgi:hypothetical protein